ncbi:MAG: hypothetical protein WAU90_06975, partial [Methyloceanibacter sp.]
SQPIGVAWNRMTRAQSLINWRSLRRRHSTSSSRRAAIFTHCGSGIVKSDAREISARVAALCEARGIEASIAYDGLTLILPRRSK